MWIGCLSFRPESSLQMCLWSKIQWPTQWNLYHLAQDGLEVHTLPEIQTVPLHPTPGPATHVPLLRSKWSEVLCIVVHIYNPTCTRCLMVCQQNGQEQQSLPKIGLQQLHFYHTAVKTLLACYALCETLCTTGVGGGPPSPYIQVCGPIIQAL